MDQVGLGEAGHRHHRQLGMSLGDGRDGGDAVHARHQQIHQRLHRRLLFGQRRLRSQLAAQVGAPAATLAAGLRSAVLEFGPHPPRDDIAIVVHARAAVAPDDLARDIGAAARLAVENERLQAELLHQLDDLRARVDTLAARFPLYPDLTERTR